MFRFPIEVCSPESDRPRKIGLRHPLLADHPYVRHEGPLASRMTAKAPPNPTATTTPPTAAGGTAADPTGRGKGADWPKRQGLTNPGCTKGTCPKAATIRHTKSRRGSDHIPTTE